MPVETCLVSVDSSPLSGARVWNPHRWVNQCCPLSCRHYRLPLIVFSPVQLSFSLYICASGPCSCASSPPALTETLSPCIVYDTDVAFRRWRGPLYNFFRRLSCGIFKVLLLDDVLLASLPIGTRQRSRLFQLGISSKVEPLAKVNGQNYGKRMTTVRDLALKKLAWCKSLLFSQPLKETFGLFVAGFFLANFSFFARLRRPAPSF